MLFAFERIQHFHNEIVDIEQLELGAPVIDRDGQVVRQIVAEGGNRAVVVRAAPLAEQVRESVDQHPRASLPGVIKEQLLARFFAPSVITVIASDASSLNGGGKHNRAGVLMPFQRIKERGCKSEIALHKFFGVLRAVDAGQIEHEV